MIHINTEINHLWMNGSVDTRKVNKLEKGLSARLWYLKYELENMRVYNNFN